MMTRIKIMSLALFSLLSTATLVATNLFNNSYDDDGDDNFEQQELSYNSNKNNGGERYSSSKRMKIPYNSENDTNYQLATMYPDKNSQFNKEINDLELFDHDVEINNTKTKKTFPYLLTFYEGSDADRNLSNTDRNREPEYEMVNNKVSFEKNNKGFIASKKIGEFVWKVNEKVVSLEYLELQVLKRLNNSIEKSNSKEIADDFDDSSMRTDHDNYDGYLKPKNFNIPMNIDRKIRKGELTFLPVRKIPSVYIIPESKDESMKKNLSSLDDLDEFDFNKLEDVKTKEITMVTAGSEIHVLVSTGAITNVKTALKDLKKGWGTGKTIGVILGGMAVIAAAGGAIYYTLQPKAPVKKKKEEAPEEEVVGHQESEGLEKEVVGHQESEGLEKEVVGHQEPEGLEKEMVGHQESEGLEEEVVGHQEPEGLEKEVVGHQESEGLEKEVVGHQEPEGLEEEVVGHQESEGLEKEVVGHQEPEELEKEVA